MLILPLTASSTKDVPDLNEYPFVLDTRSANPMRVLKCTYSWWNVAKSKTIFWKECMITEQWKRVMLQNQTHQIVQSSAMYYQNLIIIHECSKKVLKMKNSKLKCFLTPSTNHNAGAMYNSQLLNTFFCLHFISCKQDNFHVLLLKCYWTNRPK